MSASTRPLGQIRQNFAQSERCGDALREFQAQHGIAASKVRSVGIEPGHPPRPRCRAQKLCCVKRDRSGVVIIHVRDRAGFGFKEPVGIGNVGHDVRRGEIGGAGEAGIEMRGFDAHSHSAKSAKPA